VGELEFQKKCLGKMEDVSRGGRTVVFVSHQMNQMRRLCQRIVWLEGGRVRLSGPATEVIAAYEEAMTSGGAAARKESAAGARARFHQWAIVEPRGEQPHILEMLGPVRVKFRAQLASPAQMVHLGVTLYNLDNQMIWGWGAFNLEIAAGEQEFSFTFPMLPLRPGVYTWQIGLWDEEGCLDCWNALPNLIVATPNYQHRDDQWSGILNVPCEFQMAAGEQSP
jgi:lipopolysaccharide transport system ATP-binding protein